MSKTPVEIQQIVQSNAGLIHRVVMHCNNPGSVPDLEQILHQAAQNEWIKLVAAIREVMSGSRDKEVLSGLDEEDSAVVQAILDGLENSHALPELEGDFSSELAAPGIASLIQLSGAGGAHALQILAGIASQLSQIGGDMARVASRIHPMIQGERDGEKLCVGISGDSLKLMRDILMELRKIEPQ